MIAYYNSEGRYVWVGSPVALIDGAPSPPTHPLHSTHSMYEGIVDQFTQYHDVVAGVPLTMPERPSVNHSFDWNTKTWYDPRTLTELKAVKNSYINEARLTANASYFIFDGKQIAVDELSKNDITITHGGILFNNALPDPWVGGWKTIDNSYVAIPDKATWGLFYDAMVNQGTVNFNHSQALKAQLAAATTIEEIEAIVW